MNSLQPLRHRLAGSTCRGCLQERRLTDSAILASGHSKWSTIKHDKEKKDAGIGRQRASLAHEIRLAVKLGGPNPTHNPRLAVAISMAKKSSAPKSLIESAIARGQGLSLSGAKLESVTIEAMLPSSIATLIEFETDNRLRTIQDSRTVIKDHGGNAKNVAYMFERRGRVVLRQGGSSATADDVLEAALESGALDVEDGEDGTHVLYTEPAATSSVAEAVSEALNLQVASADIIWIPREDTKVPVDDEADAANFSRFMDKLEDNVQGLQAVYVNAFKGEKLDHSSWSDMQSRLAS